MVRARQCLRILLALLIAAGPLAQAAQPGTVRMGQIGLRFYAVTGAVVQEVLERLGTPHYISRVGNMRTIAEARGLLGPASDGTLVASNAWTMQAPARTLEVLGRMRLGREAVAEMDYRVNVQGMAPRAAAQAWMDSNAALVADWFAAP